MTGCQCHRIPILIRPPPSVSRPREPKAAWEGPKNGEIGLTARVSSRGKTR